MAIITAITQDTAIPPDQDLTGMLRHERAKASLSSIEAREKVPDFGILSYKESSTLDTNQVNTRSLAHIDLNDACPHGFVDCDNGYERGDNSKSCATACDGQCCQGTDACKSTTAMICKDGVSCFGEKSCGYAKMNHVVNSCGFHEDHGTITDIDSDGDLSGHYACFKAGFGGGEVGHIMLNSCRGRYACKDLGWGGRVGSLTDSCRGYMSCKIVGGAPQRYITDIWPLADGTASSQVGDLTSSCNEYKACYKAAYAYSVFGAASSELGDLTSSCNAESACSDVASATSYSGTASSKLGDLSSSCNAESACFKAGMAYTDDGSSVSSQLGDLTSSCNAESACNRTAYDNIIDASLFGCCNTANECELYYSVADLPANCQESSSTMVSSLLCLISTDFACQISLAFRTESHGPAHFQSYFGTLFVQIELSYELILHHALPTNSNIFPSV